MSDERPLRQEDYRAMAEENRRLHERIVKMEEKKQRKEKPPKPPKPGAFREWWSEWWGLTLFAVIGFGTLMAVFMWAFHGAHQDEMNVAEQAAPAACYFWARDPAHPEPWSRIYIWERRHGRNQNWDKRNETAPPGGFETQEEAHAYLVKFDVPVCK